MAEDDEILDDDILQIILVCLLPKTSKRRKASEIHPAYPLARNLILHCTSELQNSINQFILVAIQSKGKGDTALYRHYHDLIRQINRITPSLLVHTLSSLENELQSTDNKIRLKVTQTLSHVLNHTPTMYSSNRQLFDIFLSNINDDIADIRKEVTKSCRVILEYHSECYKPILSLLKERLYDLHEKVRCTAVKVICQAAERNLSDVSSQILEEVAARFIDTKPTVRMQTFSSLTSLYNEIFPDEIDDDEYLSKISWIPKKIICCYHYKNWQLRYNVEQIFNGELLPIEDDDNVESARAAVILDIAQSFIDEQPAIAAYQKLLNEQTKYVLKLK